MKKLVIYLLTIILGASIPIYFLLIWQPLKSEDALSQNILNNLGEVQSLNSTEEAIILKQDNNSNSLFNYLEGNRKESLNLILKKLFITDLAKVNNYFSNKDDKEKIKQGIELVKKRLSSSEYEMFKVIIENQVDPSILE